MKLDVTVSKLEQMKVEAKASGDPYKAAKYAGAKRQYDDLVSVLFDGEEYTFSTAPTANYVQRLRKEAESGDPTAEMRYALIKDAADYYEGRDERSREFKAGISDMRRLLESGDELTEKDVLEARAIAVQNPTASNLSIASQIKARHEAQKDGSFVKSEPAPEAKVTQAEVDAAYELAMQTSATQHIVRYSSLKRKLEAQEAAE